MNDHRLIKKYGDWVLITGASSGIGKALAIQLVDQGHNLIITGRNKKSLDALASNLSNNGEKKVVVCAGDLSKPQDVQNLISTCGKYSIGIAILNAGFGTSGLFIHSNTSDELAMIDVNCRAVCQLSHYFADKFVQAKK